MYIYIIYIYLSFFVVSVVVLRAVWWFVQGSLMFWITFHVKFPPLVLDLFLACKLIMLSPSSRAASTSSRYQTSYILGLFNKRSLQRQIDNLSRCILWVFGVVLIIHVCQKHLFCERIKGLQKWLKITESAFSDALLMSRGKTAICTITHIHTHTHTYTHTHTQTHMNTHTHAQRVCVFDYVSVCLSVFVCVVMSASSNRPHLFDCLVSRSFSIFR